MCNRRFDLRSIGWIKVRIFGFAVPGDKMDLSERGGISVR